MNSIYNTELVKDIFSFGELRFTNHQKNEILSALFEQLLIFDEVILSTDNHNSALKFLIENLGFETVERLIRSRYIKFSIRSTTVMGLSGTMRADGSIDESTVLGRPPITSGSLSGLDIDPEENIYRGLKRYDLPIKDRNRLIKLAVGNYVKTDNLKLGTNATDLILNSYTKNHLENLGLPFTKDPNDLEMKERQLLIELAGKVLNMGILSKNGFKSMDKHEELQIALKSYENIGKAYNITVNTTEILKVENTPDLKSIYLNNGFDIYDIFKLRHLKSAKHFRKWINEVGENANCNEVTEAYIAELSESNSYFDKTKGKIIKNSLVYGVSSIMGALITDKIIEAAAASSLLVSRVEKAVDYGLGLIEEFTVDGIFTGHTSKAYISDLKRVIKGREDIL